MNRLTWILTLVMAAMFFRCSDGNVCDPGDQKGCVCVGGGQGAQACMSDGSGWDACQCGGDADTDVDTDTDTDTDFTCGTQTCFDPVTGLTWEKNPESSYKNLEDSGYYCDDLGITGNSDWRLPTLSELRSLIRGCAATATGGSCGSTDECLEQACREDANDSCDGCDYEGPAPGGCFWPDDLGGECDCYWSSSPLTGQPSAWDVCYDAAGIRYDGVEYDDSHIARCVRK